MGNCEGCKYWDTESWMQERDVRKCKRVPMLWDAFDWTADGDGRVLTPEYAWAKAFVQDGSDYTASLITAADFGCTQFEPK